MTTPTSGLCLWAIMRRLGIAKSCFGAFAQIVQSFIFKKCDLVVVVLELIILCNPAWLLLFASVCLSILTWRVLYIKCICCSLMQSPPGAISSFPPGQICMRSHSVTDACYVIVTRPMCVILKSWRTYRYKLVKTTDDYRSYGLTFLAKDVHVLKRPKSTMK